MKIAIIGNGKMGRSVALAAKKRNHEIVFVFDENNKQQLTVNNLQMVDVAMEFTQPESAFENINLCFDADIPVVCGTTGWLDKLPEVKERCYAEGKTLFYAPNFSIGMNIFMRVNEYLAELMSVEDEYKTEISETHHTEKLDAPSGTAVALAQSILDMTERYQVWVKGEAQAEDELPVLSQRKGDTTGIHTVKYESDLDFIEIKHHLKDRQSLAVGAVMAAEFVADKSGFLTMDDLL